MYVILFFFMMAAMGTGGFGSLTIKHTSAATRTVVEQSKVFFVWMFFMAYQGSGHEEFQAEKLGGFVFVIIGVLFFEKILVFDGCAVKYQDEEEESDSEDEKLKKSKKDDGDEIQETDKGSLLDKKDKDDFCADGVHNYF